MGIAACVVGFLANAMWEALPWPRLRDSLLLAALAWSIAWSMQRWRGWAWADGLAAVWALALLFFAGPAATLATLLVALAALAIGSLVLHHPPAGPARDVLALPIGLVVIGGLVGWLLPLPIHHALVYWPALLAICVWRISGLRASLRMMWLGWRSGVAEAPGPAAFAVMLIGLASVGAWLPTMQADDLAYHLALPSQLGLHGVYSLDPSQQIWALAPWLGDVLQGIAHVLAGGEARGPVDALWMLLAACAVWHLGAALGQTVATRWLMVALFASQPMLAALLAGMQTELPATALLLALALAIVAPQPRKRMLGCLVLAAGLVGLKFGHAIAAAVMLAWAVVRERDRIEWKHLPVALLLLAALAGSSYFYAWRVSGNPLLPLFNHVFQAEVMDPRQLADARWGAGFGAELPWRITFDTDRYLEAWPGGYGFVLVALSGAWMLALARRRTRGIALAATLVLLLPLLPMQYVRYAFPGLALLLLPLVAVTFAVLGRRCGTWAIVALCLLNLMFQANANWVLHVSALRQLVSTGGNVSEVYRRHAPERALIDVLRTLDTGDSVVLALDREAPHVAELAGRGRVVAWYSPRMNRAAREADADASGEGWRQLIADSHARWVLLRRDALGPAQQAGLARIGAQPVRAIGPAELWSVGAEPQDGTAP